MVNYNTTLGLPYIRISEISIKDYGNGNMDLVYYENEAIRDTNGIVYHLTDKIQKFALDLSNFAEPVQAVDPATGSDISGMTFTSNQVLLGILAFIRADQKRRAEADNG
jgi:hypothetical protein